MSTGPSLNIDESGSLFDRGPFCEDYFFGFRFNIRFVADVVRSLLVLRCHPFNRNEISGVIPSFHLHVWMLHIVEAGWVCDLILGPSYMDARFFEQECIPVGCVPAARRPYAGVCFPGGGCLVRGGCLLLGGLLQGGFWSGRGWCAWSGGGGVPGPGGCVVCLVRGVGGWCVPGLGGGGCSRGGWVGIPVCTEADTPPPLVDRQMPVKILPWPTFVAAGN